MQCFWLKQTASDAFTTTSLGLLWPQPLTSRI